jgi:hypothetical protein
MTRAAEDCPAARDGAGRRVSLVACGWPRAPRPGARHSPPGWRRWRPSPAPDQRPGPGHQRAEISAAPLTVLPPVRRRTAAARSPRRRCTGRPRSKPCPDSRRRRRVRTPRPGLSFLASGKGAVDPVRSQSWSANSSDTGRQHRRANPARGTAAQPGNRILRAPGSGFEVVAAEKGHYFVTRTPTGPRHRAWRWSRSISTPARGSAGRAPGGSAPLPVLRGPRHPNPVPLPRAADAARDQGTRRAGHPAGNR